MIIKVNQKIKIDKNIIFLQNTLIFAYFDVPCKDKNVIYRSDL